MLRDRPDAWLPSLARLVAALESFVEFLAAAPASYGLEDILNTSGFVGLALLEMLSFAITF